MFRSRKLSYSYPSTTGQFNADYADLPLKKLLVNIPITQTGSGTPSPDNIRDFVGVSQAVISRTGKNLLDESIFAQYGCVLQTDGTWYIANIAPLLSVSVYEPPAGYTGQLTILLRRKSEANRQGIRFRINYTDGTYDVIGLEYSTGNLDIYTLVTNASKIVQSVTGNYGANIPCYFNLMIAIAKDTTITSYEPYTGNTYTFTFGQDIYSGSIDWEKGVVTVDWVKANTSTMIWEKSPTGLFASSSLSTIIKKNNISSYIPSPYIKCSVFECVDASNITGPQGATPSPNGVFAESTAGVVYFNLTSETTIEGFKAFMSDKQFIYELAEPIEIPLGGIDIKTLQGINNIFADVGTVETQCIKLGS